MFAAAVTIITIALLWPAGITQAGSADVTSKYVVYAWNEHDNLVAQVFLRGNPPKVVTAGLIAEYRILNNTYSSAKRNYVQFWTYVQNLFGKFLPADNGPDLVEPVAHDRLVGTMAARGTNFEAEGIPVCPTGEMGIWNPYQVAVVTVKNKKGTVLARTRTAIPTSGEINCTRCHGVDAFKDILQRHDRLHATTLASQAPVLCSDCHAAPGLS